MNVRRLMILFVAGLGLNAHAQIACTGEKSKVPVFKNVVIVVEENQSFEDVIRKDSKMPYLNDLAARGGLAPPSVPSRCAVLNLASVRRWR